MDTCATLGQVADAVERVERATAEAVRRVRESEALAERAVVDEAAVQRRLQALEEVLWVERPEVAADRARRIAEDPASPPSLKTLARAAAAVATAAERSPGKHVWAARAAATLIDAEATRSVTDQHRRVMAQSMTDALGR